MKFGSTVLRAAAALTTALLASCGGETLVAYVPARLLVFGDQASVITLDGKKYTINALDESGAPNCVLSPIWTQLLATSYSMGFPQCPGPGSNTAGRILAKAGATAGGSLEIDLAGQVSLQLALPAVDGGGINTSDLVSVLIGANDVVAAFERFKAGAPEAEAIALAEQAGSAIAAQVNRIADAGGKVIISTLPDVGLTPYGRAQSLADTARLTYLTARVNARLLVEIDNNGRKIGLIEINPYLINVVAYGEAYGYTNTRDRACVPLDPRDCTSLTLQTGATPTTWLWASELQLSPIGHAQLGNLALSRAHNQPF